MKKSFTILTSIFLSLSAIGYIALTNPGKNNRENKASSEGMEVDAENRINWELKRLADPATGRIPDNIRQKELAFASTLPNDAQASLNGRSALTLVNRGPWNVGGRTRAFGIDVTNENRLLAGSCSGGMWLSTDGGTSWNMTSALSQLKNSTCLVQDKRSGHTNVWYYGSGEAYGASAGSGGAYYLGDGLFKSEDSGASWQSVTSTAGGLAQTFSTGWQLVWNVANDVSANDSISEIYAAINSAIMRSVNGGATWTTVKSGGSYYTDVAVTTTGVVYSTLSDDGTQKGIWRSANGTSFTNIIPSGFPTAYNRVVIGINPSNENEVYFLANTPGFGKVTYNYLGDPEWNSLWKYTYLSGNGDTLGGTWQDLTINLPATGGQFDKWNVQGSYDMVVRVKPNDPNTVFIGGTNLYRSTSGFQDSTHTTFIGGYEEGTALPVVNSYANHHSDQHCLEFLPSNPNIMISANDGGVFKTMDNTANSVVWQSLNNGYLTTMFYTIAIDHATSGNDIIIAGAQDNGTWFTGSSVPTSPWFHSHGGDGSYCAIADNQTNYYFSIQNAKMVKATCDATGNKTAFTRIDPIGLKKQEFINPFVLDPNNNNLMYLAGGKYLWRNNDLSGIPLVGNWDSINTNWVKFTDSVPTANSVITALSVCKTPVNRVYYGTDKKKIYKVDNANTGTPTPIDITSTTTGALFPTSGNVSCIASDPTDGNKVVAVFSNYGVYSMFYSTNAGITWTKCAGNLEQSTNGSGAGPSIRWVSILPVADGKIYLAATSTGLYATDSLNGLSTVWVQQGVNTIGNSVCDMIDTRISDGLIVIATHSCGIYSANINSVNDLVTVNDIKDLKSDLALINYPNPVSQNTTIEFTLNKKSKVNIQIWDECGRLIETLMNETLQEGKHSVLFDRKSLNAGIYYYCLATGNTRKTNKMVIVK
ncbi:MAG: T9SS type A sorting domain-containing protein [Bacteroidota bacterium]